MSDEFRVGSECQAADDRMQPVCANDEIETARTRMLEGDIHPHFILGKSLDGVTENVVGVVGARLIKDSCEIATRELHVFLARWMIATLRYRLARPAARLSPKGSYL